MRTVHRALAILGLTLLAAGCARARAGSDASPAASTAAPDANLPAARVVGRSYPEFGSGMSPLDARVQVLVGADGKPDLRTLKITGTANSQARAAIERWVALAPFAPAVRDGQPVPSLYKGAFASRTQTTTTVVPGGRAP